MKSSLFSLVRGATLVFIAASHCAVPQAQISRPGDQIPDALKEISPLSEVCRRDVQKQGEKQVVALKNHDADLQCTITAENLSSMLNAGDSVVVDRRDAADFRSFHIEGAMNLGIADLIAKPYWRSKKVILVGNGKAEVELYRECSRLREVGYRSVHVLRGGMPSWLNRNMPLTGYSTDGSGANDISAAELLVEAQSPYNIVLVEKSVTSDRADIGVTYEIPNASTDSIKAFMERYHKSNPRALTAAVVLASNVAIDEIGRLRGVLYPIPLLVYRGSWAAVAHQQNANKAMWAAYARGPKVPGCGL